MYEVSYDRKTCQASSSVTLLLTKRLFSGEEGTAEGVLNVLHAIVAAFDDLFPNVAVVDIISKVCIKNNISCTV